MKQIHPAWVTLTLASIVALRVIDLSAGKVIPASDPRAKPALFETIAHFQTTADLLKFHRKGAKP